MIQEVERLKWQSDRDAADSAERNRREKEARKFQAEQAELNRKYNRRNLWAMAAIVLATIFGPIIGAIIAALRRYHSKYRPLTSANKSPNDQSREVMPAIIAGVERNDRPCRSNPGSGDASSNCSSLRITPSLPLDFRASSRSKSSIG